MKQIKRADLHMHSTFSDGVEEPEELVIRAKNNGVELISLTDHDETGGLERMKAAAAQHGLQFANGVEISADYGEVSIHVVGLDFDPEDEMLQALLGRIRANRFERAVQIAEKLERRLGRRFGNCDESPTHRTSALCRVARTKRLCRRLQRRLLQVSLPR